MSFSLIWMLFTTTCLGAIVIVALISKQPSAGQDKPDTLSNANETDDAQTPGQKSNKSWIWRCIGRIQRYFHECRAEKEKQNPSDRAANATARATVWIAGLTAVIIFVGILQYLVFSGQLNVMQGQLDAAQADQRPWVKIKTLEMYTDLLFDDKGIHFALKYKLENIGRSVAIKSTFFTAIKQDWYNTNNQAVENGQPGAGTKPRMWGNNQIIRHYFTDEDQIDLCRHEFIFNLKKQEREPVYIGNINTIFPSDTIEQEISVSNNENGADGFGNKDAKGKFYDIFIIACVRYIEPVTRIVRYSSYAYSLTGSVEGSPDRDIYLLSTRSLIPKSELHFVEIRQQGN